ncbi:hypothetical protein [Mitsuokella jalaludinii]|uniref:hypothetical protein n=1 Tax=Mitsuokella jalaludinii TaxID=187979 RepID=UPI003F99B7F9
MWRAKLQIEIYRFQDDDCNVILKAVNRNYAQFILQVFRDAGWDVEAGVFLDAENTLRLRCLPEPARTYFQQEQREHRVDWYRVLMADMEERLAFDCFEDEETMTAAYQRLFPKEYWPHFEVMVHYAYRRFYRGLTAGPSWQQDFYDMTDGRCLRICRCYDEICQSLLEQAWQREHPHGSFAWLDTSTNDTALQDEQMLAFILPGEGERAKTFYQELLSWVQKNKKKYNSILSLQAAFAEQAAILAYDLDFPDFNAVAAKAWRRIFALYQEKQNEERVHYVHTSKLGEQLEHYFNVTAPGIDQSVKPKTRVSLPKPIEAAAKEVDRVQQPLIQQRYYAVAQGRVCGIFLDEEFYQQALGKAGDSISEVFDSYKAAKHWLRAKREELKAKREEGADKTQAQQSLLEVMPLPGKASGEAALPKKNISSDRHQYLLDILEDMPLGPEDLPAACYSSEAVAAMRRETQDFLAYAHQQGARVMARLQGFVRRHADTEQSAKQLATAFRREKQIPASYKPLLQDLFVPLKPSPDGKGEDSAVLAENLVAMDMEEQAFLEQLAADRAYFLELGDEAETALSPADAMRAYEVSRHCPLQTAADAYLFAASFSLLFAYNGRPRKLPLYMMSMIDRLQNAPCLQTHEAIYMYYRDFCYLVVYGLQFRIAPIDPDDVFSPLADLLARQEKLDASAFPLAVWRRALACQKACGDGKVTQEIETALAQLSDRIAQDCIVMDESGFHYCWKPDPELRVRAQHQLPYLVSDAADHAVIGWFRCQQEAELFRQVLVICSPAKHYDVLEAAAHCVSQLPIHGVYETKKHRHFLLAATLAEDTARQIMAVFKMQRKNGGYHVILLAQGRETAIEAYHKKFSSEFLHRPGFFEVGRSLYEELYDFAARQEREMIEEPSIPALTERYRSLLPESDREDWPQELGLFLAFVARRVRHEQDYTPVPFSAELAEQAAWREQVRVRFLGSMAPADPGQAAAGTASVAELVKVQEEKQDIVPSASPAQQEISPRESSEQSPEPLKTQKAERAEQQDWQEESGKDSSLSVFRGIQFDKHIFRHVPAAYQERFRKTFAKRLAKMQRIFTGEARAAGNDFKLVAGRNRRRVFKRRIGDHRLSMVYKDGILTLLALSSHDRQMADIHNLQGKSIGYVYYDTADFLQQLAAWPERGRKQHLTLGDYLATPAHFVFDEDQKAAMASAKSTENLSVIGNAGAGKSVIGLKWLRQELQQPHHDALYLTMSENLVYTLSFEFEKEQLESGKALPSQAEIRTTFDFLRAAVKASHPEIPETQLLNAAQSYAIFSAFWAEQVDWTQFWNRKDPAFARQTEEMTRLSAWREIHGIIKGAVPEDIAYERLRRIREALSPAEYQRRLRREKKASQSTVLWETTLYRVYEKYQAYLHRHRLFDDNDMARLLLKSRMKPQRPYGVYGAVFVDECQDLTQMELLAIFHLLSGTRHKRMASDRCQMVQPTYFDEGWMRTTSNDYDRAQGHRVQSSGLRPRFLHYNYRSSRSIIAFQNYLVRYFRTAGLLTLRQDEMQEIAVPPLTPEGMRPVWVAAGEKNRQLLIEELWRKVPQSDLQTIFAFAGSRAKAAFPLSEEDAVTDIINCKGMEYPSVLLYDVLSETGGNPAMAWKYFYVGATRSNACLIIYEEEAVPGTKIYEFLEDAACEGLIDYVDDLRGKADYGEMNWLGYLYRSVYENVAENRLETAEHALDFGQYDLALRIYEEEGRDANMIAYCRGRLQESRGAYAAALQSYAGLAADWSDHGRTRRNAPEMLLARPDVAGREFLAAYALTGKGREDFVVQAQQAWHYKYGKDNARSFYEALWEGMQCYAWLPSCLEQWADGAAARIAEDYEGIRQAACQWPLHRSE